MHITRRTMLAAAGASTATGVFARRERAVLRIQTEPALSRPLGADSRSELRQIPALQQQRRATRDWHAPGRRSGTVRRLRYLLVNDIPNTRIMRYDEATGAWGVFRQPSNFANGNSRDRQGRLLSCEHLTRASRAPNMMGPSRCSPTISTASVSTRQTTSCASRMVPPASAAGWKREPPPFRLPSRQ
jgi:hypothetical protein